MSKTVLYQKTRTGKIQQWAIWVEKDGESGYPEVWVEHGHVDGKKQLTHDIVESGVNIGKTNETSPLQQASLTMERKITKQKEKGYVEDIDSVNKSVEISFDEPLPKELCFYKPKNSIDDKKIALLEKEDRTVYTVKRDGMNHIIRKSEQLGVEIYSRRMDLVTDKYPHIVKALENLRYDFVLLGEIILDKAGKDDFNAVSRICRSDPDKAIERQQELGLVKYYVYDMAFIGEGGAYTNLLTNEMYIDRLNTFADNIGCQLEEDSPVELCEILNYTDDLSTWSPGKRNGKTHKQALKEVQERGLEGLVVWDAHGKMEADQAFTMNGKPYRPNVVWKSKPKFEDDFIVRFDPDNDIGEYGSGKHAGKVGSVFLYQINDEGEEVFLTKCGGGLSDSQRDFYTTADYPRVWRVEYDSIQPKTGSLRYPVFNADRTSAGDKAVEECTFSDDIRNARKK